MKTVTETIEKYVSDDGKKFDSKEKCQAYEYQQNQLKIDEQKRKEFIEKVQSCKQVILSSFEEFTVQYLYIFDSEEELINTFKAFHNGRYNDEDLNIKLPEVYYPDGIKGKFTYPKNFIINNWIERNCDDPDVDMYDLYDLDLFKQRLQDDLNELQDDLKEIS